MDGALLCVGYGAHDEIMATEYMYVRCMHDLAYLARAGVVSNFCCKINNT